MFYPTYLGRNAPRTSGEFVFRQSQIRFSIIGDMIIVYIIQKALWPSDIQGPL